MLVWSRMELLFGGPSLDELFRARNEEVSFC